MAVDVGRIGVWCSSRIWPQDPGTVAEAAAELEELGYQAIWLVAQFLQLSGCLCRRAGVLRPDPGRAPDADPAHIHCHGHHPASVG